MKNKKKIKELEEQLAYVNAVVAAQIEHINSLMKVDNDSIIRAEREIKRLNIIINYLEEKLEI